MGRQLLIRYRADRPFDEFREEVAVLLNAKPAAYRTADGPSYLASAMGLDLALYESPAMAPGVGSELEGFSYVVNIGLYGRVCGSIKDMDVLGIFARFVGSTIAARLESPCCVCREEGDVLEVLSPSPN